MTISVYKYRLAVEDEQTIELPYNAKLLEVAEQHGEWCLWALVDPTAPTKPRTLRIAGTGHPIERNVFNYAHISTFMMRGGALVFHAFEVVGE